MNRFINLKLISNPINWVTVALMVAIGGFGIALIVEHAQHPDTEQKK
jgi:hypothetical protein